MLQQNAVEPAARELLRRICSLPPFEDANPQPSPVQLLSKTWEEIKLDLQTAETEYTRSLL